MKAVRKEYTLTDRDYIENPRDILTVDQVAKELGVVPQTVYRYIKSGMLKAVSFCGGCRIYREELTEFFANLPAWKPRKVA